MGLSCSLGISRFVPAKAKFVDVIFWPYNKTFIDQVCSVEMAGYWPRSFFAKEELGQYSATLTSRLVNNPYLLRVLAYFMFFKGG